MKSSESILFDQAAANELAQLVSRGEGHRLEFKLKASFPDKVVREILAFANTDGGTLLIGVDDNGSIPGVRYPEEESIALQRELANHCRPGISIVEKIIPITKKKYVLQWDIARSEARPHFYVKSGQRTSFVRQADQSIRASREMVEIIRRRKSVNGTRFTYGEVEQKIIRFLADGQPLNLQEFSRLTGLNKFLVSRKIIKLVMANVLKITPTEKGDFFSRAQ